MVYAKQSWSNGAGGATPITAARLQHMEDGIYAGSLSAGGSGPGGYVDVVAAGATGNGSTDDTGAINAAIAGSQVGDTIWFPPGGYKVTAPIVLLPGRSYLGSGGVENGGATAIEATSAVTGAIFAGEGWYNNTLTACDNPSTIQGLSIIGPGKGVGSAHGIAMTAFWTRIVDVYVSGIGGDGILFTDVTRGGSALTSSSASCSENRIWRSKIDGIGGNGLHIVNGAGFNTNQDGMLRDSLISGCAGHGVSSDQSGGWVFGGNHFYGMAKSGMSLNSGFATSVVDNYVEGDFGSENASGFTYAGIKLVQGGGWASSVANNRVATSQGGQLSTATRWSCFSLEANSGATATSPAVIVSTGNGATSSVTTTKKAYGFFHTTNAGAGAGRLQIRSAGNFALQTGWAGTGTPLTGAFFNNDTAGCVINDPNASY